jgi:DNA-binding GntR family transcriptional regulator
MEEALVRGLGTLASRKTVPDVLNLLVREGVLSKFKGKEGTVYAPERKHAGRMKQMLYELKTSKDPIWNEVSGFH